MLHGDCGLTNLLNCRDGWTNAGEQQDVTRKDDGYQQLGERHMDGIQEEKASTYGRTELNTHKK